MMQCVLCQRTCRNTCSRGSHGWCANCRDASGFLECSRCRANKAAKYQQSKQAARQSRAAIAAASAPVYIPSQPVQPITLPVRKALYQMSEAELEQWSKSIEQALSDMQARNEAYTSRRAARGTQTATDLALQRDNRVAEDIKEAMTELVILYRMAHTAISTGSSGPATGMLMEYDYDNGKVKP